MASNFIILPVFDTAENMSFNAVFPAYLEKYAAFKPDYFAAHSFLHAYKANQATFNAYRREVERLLHWAWQVAGQSILKLKRAEIEEYVKFCQQPPTAWIGLSKPARFALKNGLREPNADWRPFVATVSKTANRDGKKPDVDDYELSEKAVREIFSVLSSCYNFMIQEGLTEANPIAQVRQKSKFIRKQQGQKKIRRLSDLQWSFVIETAELIAEEDEQHERTLFIMSALYAMYLRVSELVITQRWAPQMSDFKRDADGNWWFTTVGKGNKERQIAVSEMMLAALRRWRTHLDLTPLPALDEHHPLVPKIRGKGGVTSTNQVRNIVQGCFDRAVARMENDGFKDEVNDLKTATVHWLRHTGISDDVKHRPREHVRDDAGHSSSQTTDRYIDVDLRERYRSAKNKPIRQD